MLDDRSAFARGEVLTLGQNHEYTVIEEIGRGATCIVYHVSYVDQMGYSHRARIKECYPFDMDIQRKEDGELFTESFFTKEFENAKKKFLEAYEKNVVLKNTLGLMNSTADAINLFFANNTWYSVMIYMEGEDYRSVQDEDLYSLFTRMLTLAKIIKQYHDKGMLHLDIKPENIFIIPETKELMILFDFGSLMMKEELYHNFDPPISFSDGYAAPELLWGDREKICEATDIYSIGAVVFHKIFKKSPEKGLMAGDSFDFESYKDNQYPPELYREIHTFLSKTITLRTKDRYQSTEELIPVLERLIELSDVGQLFLRHNFSYKFSYFTGRRAEIEEMDRIFERGQQVLFLSGVGGIGKTELARRYAYEKFEQYRTIAFVRFKDSVRSSVCEDTLEINGVERGEGENDEAYFQRKLKILKSVTTAEDLIIFDNFDERPDEEPDEDLELFLECPCRFLITTRGDYRDYGYEQISVKEFEDLKDLLQLFHSYNDRDYNEEEEKDIETILELIERHTMTVELIAKYLQMTKESPTFLLNQLMHKEGITSMDETEIRNRKDKRRVESVTSHLLLLFNLSDFTEGEKELIRSLSLLGYVRIQKSKFLEYCAVENCEKELNKLICRGWVEEDQHSDKISLHSVILDLVYNHLNPVSENCPHIVEAMIQELQRNIENSAKRDVRNRMLNSFIQRTTGNDLRYAKLCVLYCSQVKQQEKLLETAEEICLSVTDNLRNDLLQNINRMKIRTLFECDELWDELWGDTVLEEGQEAYLDKQSRQIHKLAEEAYAYAKAYSDNPAYLGKFCVELAYELDVESGSFWDIMIPCNSRSEILDRLFDFAVFLLDDAKEYVIASDLDNKEKENLFERMLEFFDCSSSLSMYQNKYYADEERAACLQELIASAWDSDTICFDFMMDYEHIAQVAEEKGEYKRAIKLYYKVAETESELYEFALENISDIYLKMGETDKAIAVLKQMLEKNKNCWAYNSYTYCALIDLLISENRQEEARKHAEELIKHNIEKADTKDDLAIWMIAANYRLYQMETDLQKKEQYWSNCIRYFAKLRRNDLPEELLGFLIAYADHQKTDKDKIESAFQLLKRVNNRYFTETIAQILDYIIQKSKDKIEFAEFYILARIRHSEYIINHSLNQVPKALKHAEEARNVYEACGLENKYLENLICRALGECYSYIAECNYDQILAEKGKCDYYFLAQKDAEGKTKEEQLDIWQQAADAYYYIDNFEMAEKCYARLLEMGCDEFENYCNYVLVQLRCYVGLKDKKRLKEKAFQAYGQAVEYSDKIYDWQDEADELFQKVEQYADILLDGNLEEEAFALYAVAIIIAADSDLDKKILRVVVDNENGKWEKLFSEFYRVLHSKTASENLDKIVDIYQKLAPIFEKNKNFSAFKEELQWFSDTYQYADIAFKR